MTTQEIINYYADLLILQYRDRPKAYATMQAVADPFVMDQLPAAVQSAFDINTAVGVQLDLLGKYAGVSRVVNTFNSGTVVLVDADYRKLVQMKFALNSAGSSLEDIQELIFTFFNDALSVFDYANMRMSYYFNSSYGSAVLAEAFAVQGLLPKPMGVQLASLMYVATLTDIFGFGTYDVPAFNVSGYNNYTTYVTTWPWISYQNAINI